MLPTAGDEVSTTAAPFRTWTSSSSACTTKSPRISARHSAQRRSPAHDCGGLAGFTCCGGATATGPSCARDGSGSWSEAAATSALRRRPGAGAARLAPTTCRWLRPRVRPGQTSAPPRARASDAPAPRTAAVADSMVGDPVVFFPLLRTA